MNYRGWVWIAVPAVLAVWAPLLWAGTETVIYSFAGGSSDGANPKRPVVMSSGGALYGTTVYGGGTGNGGMGYGTVFEMTESGGVWSETPILNFAGTDGGEPDGALVINGSSLYGTTSIGGTNSDGTAFQLKYSSGTWTETVLYDFAGGNDGANPYAGLVQTGGVLYGTTYNGGSSSDGTVFSLTPPPPSWSEAVIYTFTGPSDGANPHAPLLAASSTVFYGTTYNGGSTHSCATVGCGTVFELQNSSGTWSESVLYKFGCNGCTSNDGKNPHGAVVMDSSGALYGTTLAGGANGDGTLYKLTESGGTWSETILHSFGSITNDGKEPRASVIIAPSGVLYGTTTLGGANGCGTIYSYNPSTSAYVLLYSFGGSGSGDGCNPYADLLYSGGVLYGTTYSGGANGYGTVFTWQ